MSASRRDFLQTALMSGSLAPFLGSASGNHFLERLLSAEGQAKSANSSEPLGAHDSQKFWDSFSASLSPSVAAPGDHTRGLFSHKKPDAGAGALDRQIDFFHYDPTQNTMRFATSIPPKELLDFSGDVQASLAVNGLRLAAEDRTQFNQLQSAQLRIDVVQSKSLLQNLSFDPGAASQKMKQVVLPGGSGQWAVNLSMAHRQSTFCSVLQTITGALGKFAPIVGLPQIGVEALQGFSSMYGAFEQRTTFLLNSFPELAFATQQARQLAVTQQGVNLVAGDYIMVPHAYTAQLTPHLDDVELRQGYLVPKGSPTNSSVIDLALGLKPDITYLSATFGFKPIAPQPLNIT